MKKRVISVLLVCLFVFLVSVPAFAADGTQRLFDNANLLTDAEKNTLKQKLDSVSETYKVDIIIVTVETVGDTSASDFAEDFYDENQLGYGTNRDGVLLLIAMEERDYRILSNGIGAKAITSSEIETIGNAIKTDLGAENYAKAFQRFIDDCEYQIDGEINGFPFKLVQNLAISLVIGFLIAFLIMCSMKSKLKTVRRRSEATEYTKKGSMRMHDSRDIFLYRTVDRTKKENESSNSSEESRNVGGGKF